MSTALGLAMQITANTAQLAQAVADVNAKLDQMGQAGKKASDDLGTLKNIEIGKLALGGITAATEAFVAMGSAVLGAAQSVVQFALNVGQELDALNDVANRTGVNVEAIQAYARAAAETGVSVESFAKQIQRLTITIGKAAIDEKAQKSFQQLGIVFDELRTKTPEQQFEMIVDAIAKIQDPAERAAMAIKFFGKGGIELGELFTLGPGALTGMREQAVALGQVVSEDAVKAIDSMNDSFASVYATVKGLAGQILGELAPVITDTANSLLGVVQAAGPQQIAQQVASGLLDFIKLAGNAFFNLASFIEQFVKKYGGILGLELRSPEQVRRDREIDELRSAIFTRQTAVGRDIQGPSVRSMQARLDKLEADAKAEQDNSILRQAQARFNAVVDGASQNLDARMNPDGQAAPPNSAEQEQVRLLQQINRNGQVGTVEILN